MNDALVRRITAISGILIGATIVFSIPLYFMYQGPPPAWNVLTRNLVNLLTCAGLIVFVSGFAHAVRRADANYEWPASVIYGAGMLFTAMALVGVSLETGTVFGAPDGTLDPTVDGLLADANVLIHGSIKRLLSAIFLLACGYAGSRTRLIPGWLAVAAYLIAAFNLFFVPSLYFGKDATQFYSAIGWGNTAFCASFLVYWMLAVGIVWMRRAR
jgi:hypothetical protein